MICAGIAMVRRLALRNGAGCCIGCRIVCLRGVVGGHWRGWLVVGTYSGGREAGRWMRMVGKGGRLRPLEACRRRMDKRLRIIRRLRRRRRGRIVILMLVPRHGAAGGGIGIKGRIGAAS